MIVQFGNDKPISSKSVEIPFRQSQQNVTISFPGKTKYYESDIFTLLMKNIETDYVHLLV